jgi:hypothetical protein
MQLGYFASYIFLFSLGTAAWRYDWLRQLEWENARDWIIALVIAWLSFPVVCELAISVNGSGEPNFSNFFGGLSWSAIAYAIWEPFIAWGMIAAWLLHGWTAPALVKFAITGALACTTSWVLADPLVRVPGIRRIVWPAFLSAP